jgi:hypothetical protein
MGRGWRRCPKAALATFALLGAGCRSGDFDRDRGNDLAALDVLKKG